MANQPATKQPGKSNAAPGPGGASAPAPAGPAPAAQEQPVEAWQPPVVQAPITAAPKFVRQAPSAPAFRFGGGPLSGFGQGIAPSPMGMTPQGGFAPQSGMSVSQLAQQYNPYAQAQAAQQQPYGPPGGMVSPGAPQGGDPDLASFGAALEGDDGTRPAPVLNPEPVERAAHRQKYAGIKTQGEVDQLGDDEYMAYMSHEYNLGEPEQWQPGSATISRSDEIRQYNDRQEAAASRALAGMFRGSYGSSIPQGEYSMAFGQLAEHFNSQELQMIQDEDLRARTAFDEEQQDEKDAVFAYTDKWVQDLVGISEDGDIMDYAFHSWVMEQVGRYAEMGVSANWIRNNLLNMNLVEEYAHLHNGQGPYSASQGNIMNFGDDGLAYTRTSGSQSVKEKEGYVAAGQQEPGPIQGAWHNWKK